MAVSKTQNERPAITELIDAVNRTEPIVEQNVQNIATLTKGLSDETMTRIQAVRGVQNQIGEGVFSPSFTITQVFRQSGVVLQGISNSINDINQWQDRFRFGLTPSVTVEAGGSTSGTLVFETPFDDDAEVAVFPVCVDSGATLTDLSCKVTRANYQGFSFDVYNGTQAEVTIKVGYLAVKVG